MEIVMGMGMGMEMGMEMGTVAAIVMVVVKQMAMAVMIIAVQPCIPSIAFIECTFWTPQCYLVSAIELIEIGNV